MVDRRLLFASVPVALLVAVVAYGTIEQDPKYHGLADQRAFLGIPNFLNVASNLPFLLVGIAGLGHTAGANASSRSAAWSTLFAASALVFFGSAWYHWAPSSATLFWDRLPMTLGFAGLFAALIGDHFGERPGRTALAAGLAIGIASVGWWAHSGDLGPYVWVQATPLAAIPAALLLLPGRHSHRACFLHALALYLLAKLAELYDHTLYAWTGALVSGHTLKHLLAAAGIGCLVYMLKRRTAVAARPPFTRRRSAGSHEPP